MIEENSEFYTVPANNEKTKINKTQYGQPSEQVSYYEEVEKQQLNVVRPSLASSDLKLVREVEGQFNQHMSNKMGPVPPINISFDDLKVWATIRNGPLPCMGSKNKLILKGISGAFKAGTSTAILGPSGSGKTTLLNFLAARMRTKGMYLSGDLLINGHKVNSIKTIKHRFSYVMQDDILYENLTVKEQLLSTARLAGTSNPVKSVEDTIGWLGLQKCQDNLVGGVLSRGISGGEKKRASIAIEMLTNPSVVFLDEPTTGLDSKSALDVASMIQMFSENGRTVITTIHQPSSEIMLKFDNVLCMCKGEIVYFGPPNEIRSHFTNLGFAPPSNTNPADHLMGILNEDDIRIKAFLKGQEISDEQVIEQFDKRLDLFSTAYTGEQKKSEPCSKEDFDFLKKNTNSVCFAVPWFIVIKRFLMFMVRDPLGIAVSIFQFFVMTAFIIVLFQDTNDLNENTLGYIQDTNGLLFNLIIVIAFSSLTASLEGLTPLIPNFLRDYDKRLYSPTLFYVVSSFTKQPIFILLGIGMMTALSFILGLEMGESYVKLPQFWAALALTQTAAGGFGDILAVTLQNRQLANQLFPVTIVPLMLTGGAFAKVKDMLENMQAVSFISFIKYGFQSLCLIYYDDDLVQRLKSACKIIPEGCSESSCAISAIGSPACDPFNTLDFIEDKLWINLVLLVVLIVATRVISIIVINYYTIDRDLVYSKIPDESKFLKPFPKRNQKSKGVVIQAKDSTKIDDVSL